MSNAAIREFEAYRKDDLEARSILDAAASDNRDITPEESERFDKLIASADAHKARADKLASSDRDAEQLGALVRAAVPQAPVSAAHGSDAQLIANIRSIQDAHKRGGSQPGEIALEQTVNLEARAIADFSDSGSLYTTEFSTRVAVYQRTMSPWIDLAYVINSDNGRPLNIPSLTADPTTYTPGEGTAITEATPTLGSAALTTVAYKAVSYISAEAEEDELIGLLGIIAKSQGRSIGLAFGSALTTAIVAAATNGGTASGKGGGGGTTGTALNAFVGYEDLLDLKYSAPVPYRLAGHWVMANSMIKVARKFKDGLGNYIWQPAAALGQPDTLDGHPVHEDPYLTALGSATKSVLFGDPSAVVIKQMPLRVATSMEYRFLNDQVSLKTVYRAGGVLPDALALRYLVAANS